jgi:hypothetical protein
MSSKLALTLFLFASVTVAGSVSGRDDPQKKPSDSEIKKLLIGKWGVDENENGVKIKGVENYKDDGTIEAEATIDDGKNPPLKIVLSGTWKLMDGVIVSTVTKTNVPKVIPEGFVSKDTVLKISDKELTVKSEMGKEKTQKRVSEKKEIDK